MAEDKNCLQQESNGERKPPEAGQVHKQDIKFHFIIRGRNCQDYIGKCVRSLYKQGYKNWDAVISLDAPKDSSEKVMQFFVSDKICGITRYEHQGLSKNLWTTIKRLNSRPEDVVCILDADDKLTYNALQIVYDTYKKYPETLVTYGSYIKLSKKSRTKISYPYPDNVSVRHYPWRGSHLKTFKYKLWKHMKKEYFQHKGEWLQAASDLALMIPLMEMAGLKRSRHIHEYTYVWRDDTKFKTNKKLQKKCEEIIRGKNKCELL